MKELRVVLVEDEPATARNLTYVLQTLDSKIRIVATLKSVREAVEWFVNHQLEYDLVFMDVRLSDGVSFDIFKKAPIDHPVIFVTAYHDFAIQAFKNNGIDFILKPFDEQDINGALTRFAKLFTSSSSDASLSRIDSLLEEFSKVVRSYKRSFLVNYREKLIPVEAVKIAWFYTVNEIVYANTVDGHQYTMGFTMEQLESEIDPKLFFRANRQFIINRTAVTEIEFFFNGRLLVKLRPTPTEQILISKAKVAAFKSWMNN